MERILFRLFIVFLIFTGCSAAKSGAGAGSSDGTGTSDGAGASKGAANLATNIERITEGIIGTVSEIKGNQMPMKGVPESQPKGIVALILVYEATHINQTSTAGAPTLFTGIQTRQVASVMSDSSGKFSIALPPGKYSLFVKQDKGLYANLFDQFNQIALFEVMKEKCTAAKLLVSSNAKY